MNDIDLIPVRALNQVSYCPRLYYLEYVEAVMPTNEFVEDGTFQHRRVNDPKLEQKTRKDGDTLHTRSVSLSSEKLGITAKLDLIEEKDGSVQPVEYKRSTGPSGEHGPSYWENDAIQLCAQGLLLEENLLVPVPRGVLYYIGSKTRVDVPLDEALHTKTLAAIRLIRELAACDTPPEPLPAELRYRCPGCSLVTICQPEETLYLMERVKLTPQEENAAGLTRVLPHSDDGAVLYLQEQGSLVSKQSEHLIVKQGGLVINRTPIAALRQVVIFGNIQVTTQALGVLASCEVPVVYMTIYGRFVAAVQSAPTKNVQLRVNQYKVFSDPQRAFALSRAVVRAKIANQRTLLMRSLRSARETACGDELSDHSSLVKGSDEPAARDMAELLARLDNVNDPAVLLGTEGQAAALYFSQFSRMLKSPSPGRGFRFPVAQPPTATRSGQRPVVLRLCPAGQGLFLGPLRRRLRPLSRLLPRRPARQAIAGSRPDGRIPTRHRRLGGFDAHQQRHRFTGRFPCLARRLPVDRRRPQTFFRGLRTAEVHTGAPSSVRLPDVVQPHVGSSGPHVGRLCPRRPAGVCRVHGAVSCRQGDRETRRGGDKEE